jgi:hypothetical protein
MSFVFSFVGPVFIALIILLYNIRDMIIILDSMICYIILLYMIIINFDRSLFFGLYWSYVDFLGPYYI